MAERVLREVVVPAAHGGAIEVRAGEYLSIIDLEGAQVADLVAIQRDDPRRFLSPHQTRSTLRRWTLRVGDRLVDNNREPVFEIVRDDVGVHDLFFCACSPTLYRQRFGLTDHRSIVTFDMDPGDCIVFHGLTVHGAPGNLSRERRRRALSVIWLGDDTVFAARPGPVRPLFEGHDLKPGDRLDSDYFPRVWPRSGGPHPSGSARFTDPGFRISI